MGDLPEYDERQNVPLIRLPRLARHSALYIAVPVFQRSLYFLMVPVFTRYLTPAEYGAWGYVTVAATLLGTLAPLGLLSSYNYALRRPEAWSQPAAAIRRASLQTAVILVTLTCAAAFLVLRHIPLGMDTDRLWLVVLAATVGGFLVQAGKRRYQMLEQPKPYARLDLTFGITVAAASYIGVVYLKLGVVGLATGLIVAATLGAMLSWRDLKADLIGKVIPAARKEALNFGLPLFIHTGAAVLLQYLDRFMLERMGTLTDLGLYSLAGQIGTAMLIITTATNQAYLPFLYRQFEAHFELVVKAQRYVGLFFLGVGMLGMLMTPWVIRHFIDPRYLQSIRPAQILLAAGILHGWYYLMVGRLMVRGRTRAIAIVTLIAAAFNVVANYLLIPRYMAEGAAWATLLSEGLLFLLSWWAARRALATPVSPDSLDTLEAGS
jgi:O-antigen/teichoic acid export membrane protein